MKALASLCLLLVCSPQSRSTDTLGLVESWPIESSLDNADIPDTADVWLELIARAERSIELGHFYASNHPGSRLEEVVLALEQAAARDVHVRFLASDRFYETYPETLERLNAVEGIEMRRFDMREHTGGVLHAKFMVIDGREATLGSANFDWRSLVHIQELGVVVSNSAVVDALLDVFQLDWALAGGEPAPERKGPAEFPVELSFGGTQVRVTPVFSPGELLPDPALWDLPRLIEWIDAAQTSVRVQLLTYRTVGYDKTYFGELESALRGAAARGAKVELLLAHWSKRKGTIEGLQSLQALPNIEVRLMTVPEWSEGFIPFGRVAHSKYMTVDGERAWVGTSNWESGYFHESRNVGLLVEGAAFASRLDEYFRKGWENSYSETVDPSSEYEAPRVGE